MPNDSIGEDMSDVIGETALKTQIGGNHYKDYKIQPLVFCYENNIGIIESNVIKYVCRHKTKGGYEDIKKAIHYLEMLLELDYHGVDPNAFKEDIDFDKININENVSVGMMKKI